MRSAHAALLVLILSTPAQAGPGGPTLAAGRRAGSIQIDGRTDEQAWAAAVQASGFRQTQPDEGVAASADTRFRALWDDDALYFAIDCDEPDAPLLQVSRRDRAIEADAVRVTLDTMGDRRSGYQFTVYAAGPQMDALLYDDTGSSTEWDGAWDSAVARTAAGWSVEVRIPLRLLRVPSGVETFGLNVSRSRARRHEESAWRFVPRGSPGVVSQLGTLEGLGGIKPVRAIEFRPYLATTIASARPGAAAASSQLGACSTLGVAEGTSARTCAGLDFKLGLTSDLALLGAINPDFGQVEADQHVLNLTTFESQFPEKRPFFQEGLDLFQPAVRLTEWGGDYGGDALLLFYSRRLGAALAPPEPGPGEVVVQSPAAQPILGAAKLVGHLGPAAVTLLSAVMTRARAELRAEGGERREVTVAGPAHAAALRARVPVGPNVLAGVSATAWDPLDAPGARHAHTGAVDVTLFDADREWNASAQVAGSRVAGGAPIQEPDGTTIAGGDTGAAVSARVAREGGALTGFVDVDWLSPRLAVNDLGFARRANLFRTLAAVALRDVHANALWQNAQVTLSGREIRTADLDDVLYRDLVLEPQVTLSSFWTLLADVILVPARGDDRELGDGTFLHQRGGWGVLALLGSDATRRLSGQVGGTYGVRGASRQGEAFVGATLRPSPRLETQLELDYATVRDDVRLLRGPMSAIDTDRVYLLAPRSSQALSATLKGTLALAPDLTLQLYAQLFSAGIHDGDPLRAPAVAGQRAISTVGLEAARPEDAATPTAVRQAALDVNLILRWEWRRGSAFYVVYAHQSSGARAPDPASGLSLGDELGTLSSAGNLDSLLVKIDVLSAL